jgi:hypothetical protein
MVKVMKEGRCLDCIHLRKCMFHGEISYVCDVFDGVPCNVTNVSPCQYYKKKKEIKL